MHLTPEISNALDVVDNGCDCGYGGSCDCMTDAAVVLASVVKKVLHSILPEEEYVRNQYRNRTF